MWCCRSRSKDSTETNIESTDQYSVDLTSRPFGLQLIETYPDGKNLFVKRCIPGSEAERAGVQQDSVLIAINGESCEDIGSAEVDRRFGEAAGKDLPLNVTFRAGLEEEVKPSYLIAHEAAQKKSAQEHSVTETAMTVSMLSLDDRVGSAESIISDL